MKILLNVFSLLCCSVLFSQVPNGGFENWSNDSSGALNPDYWITNNDGVDTNTFRVSPGYSGSYAMMVRVLTVSSFNIPGVAYIEFPFTLRPTSIRACIRSTVSAGDQNMIMYGARFGDSLVAATGNCSFKIDSNISTFRCMTFPLAVYLTIKSGYRHDLYTGG